VKLHLLMSKNICFMGEGFWCFCEPSFFLVTPFPPHLQCLFTVIYSAAYPLFSVINTQALDVTKSPSVNNGTILLSCSISMFVFY
jgi:hypothetical protein